MALDVFSLNGVSLNDETNYALEALDLTPPKKKPEWAQAADGDGAGLIRTPLFENRLIKATIRVAPQSSMDNALAKIGVITDLLQESEKNPEGIPLTYTPAGGTKTITFYPLTGEVVNLPMVMEGVEAGWYANVPRLMVEMTCKPFGYGAEVEAAAAKSIETGLSVVTLTVPTVAGDVPAEGRLVVKDTATVGRRFVEWGLENRYYNAATALILDSEDMTPVGGTQVTAPTGAYKRAGATKNSILTVLLPEPTICCETGVLKHVGTFRVKARVYAAVGAGAESKTQVRLSWQDGEGPFRANTWAKPPIANTLAEVDLGTITISPAITGTQRWSGRIEAYAPGQPAVWENLYVDYLTFIPAAEGYGKARGVQSTAPGTVSAFDNFTTGTLSGSLNARTPAVGAAWATSGATTDWAVASAQAQRKTKSDAERRIGVIGAAIGNGRATATFSVGALAVGGAVSVGAIVRWVNATNYAFMLGEFSRVTGSYRCVFKLGVVVAGVTTILGEGAQEGAFSEKEVTITETASLDGALSGSIALPTGSFSLAGSHTSIATGGALASGKGGVLDQNANTAETVRLIKSLNVSTLPAIPYCIQPSRTMEVRSDSAIVADSTGAYFGPVPQYRGSRFFVPQDGSANRTSRILVKADRNDLEVSDEQTIADAFTAQIFATPRYHVIPR